MFCIQIEHSVLLRLFRLFMHSYRRVRINYRPRPKMKKAERHWVTIDNSANLSRSEVLNMGLAGPSIKAWLQNRRDKGKKIQRAKQKLSTPNLKHRQLGMSTSFSLSSVIKTRHHTHESVGTS